MVRAGIRRGVAVFVATSIVAWAATIRGGAQTAARPQPAVSSTVVVASTGTVIGSAWKGDTTPYPNARLRLRNVETGRGVARTEGNAEGRFRFERVERGLYAVELLSTQDKVLAIGELFSVTAGGQSTTLVRLSSKAPWFGAFFGNAAAAVVSAASTLGVTAVGSNGSPVSPQ